jgi:TonB family protein
MKRLLLATATLILCAPIFAADRSVQKIPSHKKALCIYGPRPELPVEARLKHLGGSGIFVLHTRQDGAVLRVETLKSTGHAILDKACVDAFSRWRFAANSMKEIKIPVTFSGNYPRP